MHSDAEKNPLSDDRSKTYTPTENDEIAMFAVIVSADAATSHLHRFDGVCKECRLSQEQLTHSVSQRTYKHYESRRYHRE